MAQAGRLRRRRDHRLGRLPAVSTFLVQKTNLRTDRWGGPWENRMRFPVEVVRRVRAAVGERFMRDLPHRGDGHARRRPGLGRDRLARPCGGGRRAPTSSAPISAGTRRRCRPSRRWCRARPSRRSPAGCARELGVPMITSNRINMPQVAEDVLARGDADLVSMARPMLADPELVNKAARRPRGRDQHLHRLQPGLPGPHLRRPAAGELPGQPARLQRDAAELPADAPAPKRIAVVGAGPAGLAFATTAAQRGHRVTLFDAARRDRRPVQPGQAHPRQGRVPRDAALLPHDAGQAGRRRSG